MDADITARFRSLLKSHDKTIAQQWRASAARALRGRQSEAELGRQVEELLATIERASQQGSLDLAGGEAGELRALLSDLSESRARLGFSAAETAGAVMALKEAIFVVADTGSAEGLTDYLEYARFIDQMGIFTFENYAKSREALIADQAEQLLELATPVVKLWDGVVAVPLVGTLDSARAQVVMERLLQALVETSAPYAIIDITGVPAVDTQVAQHVLKTVVAARLMGADCVISGIRPQIAQTIVALGIEFDGIVTKASLADALTHALRASGVELAHHGPARAS